jgi:hypothetical protein
MSSSETFQAATELIQPIYAAAVIHLVAELRGTQWCNLYTSVIYGREIDLLSVPDYVEHDTYGSTLLCLRARFSRSRVEAFLASARTGTATCDSWTIAYATQEEVVGFRPATTKTDLNESSFWETSLWTRERIGTEKIFNGEPLRNSNAWKVAEYLECLNEARWLPIPLQRHPEKLGDLDEIWPSPISLESRNRDRAWEFEVTSMDPSLLTRDVAITGSLLRNDLIVRALHYHGSGPHTIDEDFDSINVLVTVDGVPLDAHAHRYLRALTMRTTLYSGARYTVPPSGSRPEMEFAIGQPIVGPSVIGTPRTDIVRNGAWIIGRLFRHHGQPGDSERVYDPRVASDTVEQAFRDLQWYGRNEGHSEVIVADPYALDERALDAIAVTVARGGQVSSVRVLTAFFSSPKDTSLGARFLALFGAIFDRKNRGRQTAREKTEADARSLAQKIATKLNVAISFYKIESLHDRFLLVGERLWHVGCSFNTIGQQISAVIEIRDERAKAMVLDIFERTMAQGPVFQVTP